MCHQIRELVRIHHNPAFVTNRFHGHHRVHGDYEKGRQKDALKLKESLAGFFKMAQHARTGTKPLRTFLGGCRDDFGGEQVESNRTNRTR
jgi:hypothetical protein